MEIQNLPNLSSTTPTLLAKWKK